MLPDSDHNEELTPDNLSGVLINYQWRRVIVGILERELPRIAPVDISEADMNTYQDRIDALIEDIYTIESVPVVEPFQLNTERDTSTQTLFAASSPNAIIWNQGSFVIANPTRLPCTVDGIYLITANFRVTNANAIVWEVRLRKNGTDELLRVSHVSTTSWQASITWQFSALDGDYVEILIATTQNAILQITTPICAATMLVIPSS